MANTNRSDIHESFLQLVRLGIGTSKDARIYKDVDWVKLKALANRQGLSAVVLDGIDRLNTNSSNSTNTLPVAMKLEWIGEVLQNYEQRYRQYQNAISSLAGFYNQHGFKMMVLKGYACSLDWPMPEHRPCGDMDIWQFGDQKEADVTIASEKGVKVDDSHHHHTVFEGQGFTVENHYDFINVYQHKSHKELEMVFKDLGKDDTHYVEVDGERVYLPSPNLHALFLIKHNLLHFVSGEMTFRQLLDWTFFVKKHKSEIDWEWLNKQLETYGMKEMFNIINAICVGELGFAVDLFPTVQFDPNLKDRIVRDMFNPEFSEEIPHGLLKRFAWRYRHWKVTEWKHDLCFTDSMWSSFWSGVWGHLLKPSSI